MDFLLCFSLYLLGKYIQYIHYVAVQATSILLVRFVIRKTFSKLPVGIAFKTDCSDFQQLMFGSVVELVVKLTLLIQ